MKYTDYSDHDLNIFWSEWNIFHLKNWLLNMLEKEKENENIRVRMRECNGAKGTHSHPIRNAPRKFNSFEWKGKGKDSPGIRCTLAYSWHSCTFRQSRGWGGIKKPQKYYNLECKLQILLKSESRNKFIDSYSEKWNICLIWNGSSSW